MSHVEPVARGLSVRQPWAWAIASGRKSVENRTRAFPRTLAGVPVALHASLTYESALLLPDPAAASACITAAADLDRLLMPGAIIAVVTFSGSHAPVGEAECRCGGSVWVEPTSHHWTVTTVQPLAEPVPCRGMPGFWPLPPGLAEVITAQLHAGHVRETG